MAQTVIQQKYTNLHSDLPLHSRSWFHDGVGYRIKRSSKWEVFGLFLLEEQHSAKSSRDHHSVHLLLSAARSSLVLLRSHYNGSSGESTGRALFLRQNQNCR